MTRSIIILALGALPAMARPDDSVRWTRLSGGGYTLEGAIAPIDADRPAALHQPAPCPADLTRDGRVDSLDFLAFINAFGTHTAGGDIAPPWGRFDTFDFLAFQSAYERGCE